MKAHVTRRALVQRINRKLPAHEQLRAARGAQVSELGDFFIISQQEVQRRRVDIESLARRLGVLRAWEALAG